MLHQDGWWLEMAGSGDAAGRSGSQSRWKSKPGANKQPRELRGSQDGFGGGFHSHSTDQGHITGLSTALPRIHIQGEPDASQAPPAKASGPCQHVVACS